MLFRAEQSVNLSRNRGYAVLQSPANLNSISFTSDANRRRELTVVQRLCVRVKDGSTSRHATGHFAISIAQAATGSEAVIIS